MRSLCFGALALLFLAFSVSPASASLITCSATLDTNNGQGATLYTATLDPAIGCYRPVADNNAYPDDLWAFGRTWLSQAKLEGNGSETEDGVGDNAFTGTGLGTNKGEFTVTPGDTLCGSDDCNTFVIGLKFDGVVAYFNLGLLTGETSFDFDWTTDPNALSNAALYGRLADLGDVEVTALPEPTSMLLLGTGLAAVAVRRYRRRP